MKSIFHLPRPVLFLFLGYTVNFFGSGMTMPFLMIYLHVDRLIPLVMAGFVISFSSLMGLLSTPVVGYAVDRLGSFKLLVLALLLLCIGTMGYAVSTNVGAALLSSLLVGVGNSAMWNGLSSQLAVLAGKKERSRYFGIAYAAQNLGIGLGSLISGLLLHSMKPTTFFLVFLIDAFTYLVFIPLLLPLRNKKYFPNTLDPEEQLSGNRGGFREVVRDRALVGVTVLNLLFVVFGYSQMNTAFSVWATGFKGVGASVVGIAFFVNCMAIVLVQFPVLHYAKKWRRTRLAAFASALFAISWLLVLFAGVKNGHFAAPLLITSLAIFGVGETFLSPSLSPIVNDLAPEQLRGRYNAMINLSWQAGMVIGPVIAGYALGHALGFEWFLLLAVVLFVGVVVAIRLEHWIPSSANR